jgi:hypothetical protein
MYYPFERDVHVHVHVVHCYKQLLRIIVIMIVIHRFLEVHMYSIVSELLCACVHVHNKKFIEAVSRNTKNHYLYLYYYTCNFCTGSWTSHHIR